MNLAQLRTGLLAPVAAAILLIACSAPVEPPAPSPTPSAPPAATATAVEPARDNDRPPPPASTAPAPSLETPGTSTSSNAIPLYPDFVRVGVDIVDRVVEAVVERDVLALADLWPRTTFECVKDGADDGDIPCPQDVPEGTEVPVIVTVACHGEYSPPAFAVREASMFLFTGARDADARHGLYAVAMSRGADLEENARYRLLFASANGHRRQVTVDGGVIAEVRFPCGVDMTFGIGEGGSTTPEEIWLLAPLDK
jgi:hypothetical protein